MTISRYTPFYRHFYDPLYVNFIGFSLYILNSNNNSKQLLDEAELDIQHNSGRGQCNIDRGLNYSEYPAKAEIDTE